MGGEENGWGEIRCDVGVGGWGCKSRGKCRMEEDGGRMEGWKKGEWRGKAKRSQFTKRKERKKRKGKRQREGG